jgi:hypothetical protein
LQAELSQAAIEALERMRDESKKTSLRLVDMEASYLTVDFFRKLPQDVEKGGNPATSAMDRYTDNHLRRIGEKYQIVFVSPTSYASLELFFGSPVSHHWHFIAL